MVNTTKITPKRIQALLALREALLKEQYEKCRGFIHIAREFGARKEEIRDILEVPERALNDTS